MKPLTLILLMTMMGCTSFPNYKCSEESRVFTYYDTTGEHSSLRPTGDYICKPEVKQ